LKIEVTGRHLEITDGMREYAGERGERLFRYYDRIQSVQFVLSQEGVRFTAEVVVSAPRAGRMAAEASEESLQAAVDKALDKMERQIRRHKERLRDHRREEGRAAQREEIRGEEGPEPE
jgi:putative sigma-54 modulation protein